MLKRRFAGIILTALQLSFLVTVFNNIIAEVKITERLMENITECYCECNKNQNASKAVLYNNILLVKLKGKLFGKAKTKSLPSYESMCQTAVSDWPRPAQSIRILL